MAPTTFSASTIRSRSRFPTNVPKLCGRCHREGKKAALRYTGDQHEIIQHYTESIHGKGLLKSGLTVTATCTSCHTAHLVLPRSDPESTVNPEECARHLRRLSPRHSGAVRRERALGNGHEDGQGTAGLQRLPHRALHSPHR